MNQTVQTQQMEKVKKTNMLGQKGFFIISKEKWKYLFDINSNISEMASYLVLACGTGADHKTTSWSAGAIYQYSGISPKPATKAIMRLNFCSAIETKKEAKKGKFPIYKIIFDQNPKTDKHGDNIYIPCGVVTGVMNEDSPLKRLVNYQNRELLYLFIRLYAFQDKYLDCISPEFVSSSLANDKGLVIESEYNESGYLDLCSFDSNTFSISAQFKGDFYNFMDDKAKKYSCLDDPFHYEWNSEDGEHHEKTGVWGFYQHLINLGLIQPSYFVCRGESSTPDAMDVICEVDRKQQVDFMQIMSDIHTSKGKNSFIYDIDIIKSGEFDNFIFVVLPSKYKKSHVHKVYKMTYKTKVGASKAGFSRQKAYENEVKFFLEKVK